MQQTEKETLTNAWSLSHQVTFMKGSAAQWGNIYLTIERSQV